MTNWHEIPPTTHPLPDLVAAVPVLTTERLVLRAPSLADFPLIVAINDDLAELSQREGAGTRAGAWADFVQMTATWLLRGHGWWTVTADDLAVGFVGLGFEPGDREPELGYLLGPEGRGRGYATEACVAARDFARDELKLPSLISYIHDQNTASQNVARKLNATRDQKVEQALGEAGVHVWRHWGAEGA